MPHPVFDGPDWGVEIQNMSSLVIDCVKVSYIENRAYYNEKELEWVRFTVTTKNQDAENDDKQEQTSGASHLVSIGTKAFACCKKMQNIYSLPTSLRHIGNGSFATCISLLVVDLPDGLQLIGENAFLYCNSLVNVRIPSTVTTIADGTFSGCFRLRSLELPPTLTRIGTGAFRDCSSLINICLPRSIEALPRHSFSGCTLLLIKLPCISGSVLLKSIQQRFQDLPLHHLLYYQSYECLESPDQVLADVQEIMARDEDSTIDDSVLTKQDAMGMNPLHVLALSARPNSDLSNILFNHIRRNIGADDACNKEETVQGMLTAADQTGNEPLSYAFNNRSSGSGHFIAQLLKTIHMKSIAQLGCPKWTSQIHSKIDCLFLCEDGLGSSLVERRRRQAKQIQLTIERYRMKERLACLELGIWKSKLENLCTLPKDLRKREDCRTTCGSNVILSQVVGFLYYQED